MQGKILKNALGILLAVVIMAAPEDEPAQEEDRLQAHLAGTPAVERHERREAATPP